MLYWVIRELLPPRRHCCRQPKNPASAKLSLGVAGVATIFPGSLIAHGIAGPIGGIAALAAGSMMLYLASPKTFYALTVITLGFVGPLLLTVGIISTVIHITGHSPLMTWHELAQELTIGTLGTALLAVAIKYRNKILKNPPAEPAKPSPQPPPDDDGPLNPRMYYSNRR